MSSLTRSATTTTTGPSTRRARLSPDATLVLLASLVVSFLAASSVPTPLYAVYQREWGFSSIVTTVVFGTYAVAVLAALLVVGRLSDHVGRRPVILAGLLGQAVSMVVFVTATGVTELLVARVVQGIATGAVLGAIGASLLDVDPRRGPLANAVAPGAGSALGALLSGLVVQFLPAPTRLVYLMAIGVFAVQAVAVVLMTETVIRRPGARRSLVPELGLPRETRQAVLRAAPVLFAVWALAGFYGALGPAIIREVTGSTSLVLGGLGLFVLAGVASLATFVLRAVEAKPLMRLSIAALVSGVSVTQLALVIGSTPLFFLGTAVAGLGFGTGFQAGLRSVMSIPRPHERAGVLSVLYVVSYLGMGLPAVVAGLLVVHGGGLLATAHEYAMFVTVSAVVALVLRSRPTRDVSATPEPSARIRQICSEG